MLYWSISKLTQRRLDYEKLDQRKQTSRSNLPHHDYLSHHGVVMKKLLILLFLLPGCALSGAYQSKMEGWIGHDTNELVQVWGYPNSSFVAPNGNTVYLYSTAANGHVPAYTTPDGFAYGNYTFGNQTTTWYCNTYFEIDSNKNILQVRWDGNTCK